MKMERMFSAWLEDYREALTSEPGDLWCVHCEDHKIEHSHNVQLEEGTIGSVTAYVYYCHACMTEVVLYGEVVLL